MFASDFAVFNSSSVTSAFSNFRFKSLYFGWFFKFSTASETSFLSAVKSFLSPCSDPLFSLEPGLFSLAPPLFSISLVFSVREQATTPAPISVVIDNNPRPLKIFLYFSLFSLILKNC
ncbi:hypothetical protein [Mycoplasmopsis cynos]|uniref:hypothetical protein n=1 Tax=Mycoplasmopsis cynos TaxID=171284 RepID=UPI0024C9D3C9|nr:hypothetical protein [Mycoplasmopsis cynos]WAM04226.1 hypothetical protein ONA01_04100 [Mycoplasmopsis cynos]